MGQKKNTLRSFANLKFTESTDCPFMTVCKYLKTLYKSMVAILSELPFLRAPIDRNYFGACF